MVYIRFLLIPLSIDIFHSASLRGLNLQLMPCREPLNVAIRH